MYTLGIPPCTPYGTPWVYLLVYASLPAGYTTPCVYVSLPPGYTTPYVHPGYTTRIHTLGTTWVYHPGI